MDISTAYEEFAVRRYLWAKLKAAEEIEEEFPHFWLFKDGMSWKRYQFIRSLNKLDQQLFVSAQLKRGHRQAVVILGETVSSKERAIEDEWFRCHLKLTDFEKDLVMRRRRGERVRFLSKRKVQKFMVDHFERAFCHDQFGPTETVGTDASYMRTRCCGWIVQTNFFFGRVESRIRFNHTIASEDQVRHPTTLGITGPALLLANGLCWINLGRMEWEYLTDADVEPACDAVIQLCRDFFDDLPKLLKGIDRDKVTPAPQPLTGDAVQL